MLRRKWVNRHLFKGEVIRDRLLAMVIGFDVLEMPMGSDRSRRKRLLALVADQLRVIERLHVALKKSKFGDVVGWAFANHYSFLSPKRLGQHLHLGILCGLEEEGEVLERIRAFGRGVFTVEPDEREDSHLEGFLAYLRHQPFPDLMESEKAGFTPAQRLWVEDVLVRPWCLVDGKYGPKRPLCVQRIGGEALSTDGFQEVRARARLQVVAGRFGLRQSVSDVDRSYAHKLRNELKDVRHLVRCPICKRRQVGQLGDGLNYACSTEECLGTWADTPVFRHREKAQMTKLFKKHAHRESRAIPETKDPALEQGVISQQAAPSSDLQSNKSKTLCREPDGEITVHRGDAGRKEKRSSGVG